MKIVLATKNQGKLRELSAMAKEIGDTDFDFVLAPDEFDPEETGTTYLENAVIKATEAARMTNILSIADDSGLAVDALDGRPGVFSARYSGHDEAAGRRKLLDELKDVPDGKRGAQYVCCMAVCAPSTLEVVYTVETYWRGRIGLEERGTGGFGFDPIFYENNSDVTVAQLPAVEKNQKSHRGQAWRQVLSFLEKTFIS